MLKRQKPLWLCWAIAQERLLWASPDFRLKIAAKQHGGEMAKSFLSIFKKENNTIISV